jgi:hypothetical protein
MRDYRARGTQGNPEQAAVTGRCRGMKRMGMMKALPHAVRSGKGCVAPLPAAQPLPCLARRGWRDGSRETRFSMGITQWISSKVCVTRVERYCSR